jgi:hypothetical protein
MRNESISLFAVTPPLYYRFFHETDVACTQVRMRHSIVRHGHQSLIWFVAGTRRALAPQGPGGVVKFQVLTAVSMKTVFWDVVWGVAW